MNIKSIKDIALAVAILTSGIASAAKNNAYPNVAALPGDFSKQAEWYQQCLTVQFAKPPSQDIPEKSAIAKLKNCSATNDYYRALDLGMVEADWKHVRHCAFATDDSAVLMMLYANGKGVSKDVRLATKYACSVESSPAEVEGRVDHLASLAAKGTADDFDLCDDITSGFMQGQCADIAERRQARKRSAQFAVLAAEWSVSKKAAFENLQKALNEFARRRAENETDLSGTARRALQINAEAAEREQFAKDIDVLEKTKAPQYTSVDFVKLDRHLNHVYKRIMRTAHTSPPQSGAIEKSGITNTQRAWLAYRDAWVKFGSVAYPRVEPQSWMAMFTERRIKQLTELSEDNGQPEK